MRVIVVKWKRIESQKKELATHNSFEKELKESILQLSTPESLLLYVLGISGRHITKGAFRRVHIDILYSPNDVGGDARNLE